MAFTVKVNREGINRLRTTTSLLQLTEEDMRAFVLPGMATLHREQEMEIFASEGAGGGAGAWPRLSAAYAARKARAASAGRAETAGKKGKARVEALRAAGRPISQKILVWSGETRDRFTRDSSPGFVAQLVVTALDRWIVQLGARSDIASYHVHGSSRLPLRDMIAKTAEQLDELRAVVVQVYRQNLERYRKAVSTLGGRGPIGGAVVGRAASPAP